MKAIVNIPRRFGLYYTVGALDTPRVLVYDPDGALATTMLMSTSADSSNLHWTKEPYTFNKVGTWTLKFQHLVAAVYTTVATDVMEVGVDYISDFPLSLTAGAKFRLDDATIGDTTSNVTAKVIDLTGKAQGASAATYAKFTGNAAVTTISVNDSDALQIKIDALASKTATFLAEAAQVTGVGGTFTSADANTTAEISVNGGAAQTINMDGVADGIAAWVTSLDSQITGADVTNSGGQIRITTTRLGSSAKFTLSNFGSNFAALSGLTAATTIANPANNNVADSSAVTFSEIQAVIQDGIKTSVAGDILGVTQDSDNNIILTARNGSAGITSKIDLESGTAALITALGLDDLGSQGSKAIKIGTAADSYDATYYAADSAYVFTSDAISVEGPYYVLWYDDGTLTSVVEVFATNPRGYELIKISVASVDGTDSLSGSSAPHAYTDVLLSEADGTPVTQGITNEDGEVTLTAPPGSYVLSLRKTGIVFSRNNVTFKVLDTETEEGANTFEMESDFFAATFESAPSGPDKCTLYGTLFDFTGSPLTSAEILVSLASGPQNLSGSGTFGTAFTKKTDKQGKVEFELVRGVKVTITVVPSSLRRTITVPNTTYTVSTSSAADPTVITTSTDHGLTSGETVTITGHSVDAVNGDHVVTVTGTTTFTIPVSSAGGSGGTMTVKKADFIARMSGADDPFDIVIVNTPIAPRRSI